MLDYFLFLLIIFPYNISCFVLVFHNIFWITEFAKQKQIQTQTQTQKQTHKNTSRPDDWFCVFAASSLSGTCGALRAPYSAGGGLTAETLATSIYERRKWGPCQLLHSWEWPIKPDRRQVQTQHNGKSIFQSHLGRNRNAIVPHPKGEIPSSSLSALSLHLEAQGQTVFPIPI